MILPNRTLSRMAVASAVLVVALALAGCAMPFEMPFDMPFGAPTATFTPSPVPTATPTPAPTNTPKAGETPVPATATPVPTPQVTVPDGYTPVTDAGRGYSLAVPRGWSELDLRSAQFQNMANTFGMGGQLGPLNDFLASPEGEALGVIYWTDLTAAMFGGLPTALNVFVLDAPGATPDSALTFIQDTIEANSSMLGGVQVNDLQTATINNMPAVRGNITADLSSVGMNAQVFGKVVGIIANDKIYILSLVTQASSRGDKEPVFDQIIGTFRPE